MTTEDGQDRYDTHDAKHYAFNTEADGCWLTLYGFPCLEPEMNHEGLHVFDTTDYAAQTTTTNTKPNNSPQGADQG